VLFSEAHFDVGEVVALGLLYRYDKGRFYPEGGEGNFDKVGIDKGEGYNINVPWPHGGFGDADYLAVWEHILMPVALDFNPDIVFISAGCDPGNFHIPRPSNLCTMDTLLLLLLLCSCRYKSPFMCKYRHWTGI
jgi:hypothetical protein